MKLQKFDYSLLFPGAVPGVIAVTAWLVIYISSSNSFTLSLGDALLLAGGSAAAAMFIGALFLYAFSMTPWNKWITAGVLGFSCSMILQYYGSKELFGDDYLPDSLTADSLLLMIFHILFLALPLAAALWQRERCFKWRIRISIVLLLMQAVTLGHVCFSAPEFNDNYDFREYAFSEKEKFTFGSKENIIVLVVDCMGERGLKELLIRYPELQKSFRDFICFDRMESPLPRTMYAVPALLTGIEFPSIKKGEPDENEDHGVYLNRVCRDKKSLLQLARAGNFRVEGYPFLLQTISYGPDVIDNSEAISQEIRKISVQKIVDVMLVRLIPVFLKPFINCETEDEVIPFVQQKFSSEGSVELSYDQNFYQRLQKEFRIGSTERVFKYLHIHGAHDPVTVDENLESAKDPLRYQQFRGSLRIVELLLRKLKENGIYDSSTILITGDHTEKYAPEIVSFIKRPFEKRKELVFNSVPCRISQLSGSIAKAAGLDNKAVSLFDLAFVPGNIRDIRDKKTRFPRFTPWKKQESLEKNVPEGVLRGTCRIEDKRIMVELAGESSLHTAEKIFVTAENILTAERFRTTLIREEEFSDILLPEFSFPDGDYLFSVTEEKKPVKERTASLTRIIPHWFRVKNGRISILSRGPDLFHKAVCLDEKMDFHPFACWPGISFSSGSSLEWNCVLLPEKEKILLRLPDLSRRYQVEISWQVSVFEKGDVIITVNGREKGKSPLNGGSLERKFFSVELEPGKDGIAEIAFEYRIEKKTRRRNNLRQIRRSRIFNITVRHIPPDIRGSTPGSESQEFLI